MVLTKDEILQSPKDAKEYEIESIGGSVKLRILSQKEINEIQTIESAGLGVLESQESGRRIKGKTTQGQFNNITKINATKQIAQSAKAKIRAVALSLSNEEETWKDTEVEQIPAPAFNEIYEKVSEINQLSPDVESEVDEFPED
ncbi:hypothetical protein [Methanosphaera sp.]|uniref:hypothetical protein n=1 Tax=Methanosphaera sp. TaxID=2666342 RepID=UPI003D8ACEFE